MRTAVDTKKSTERRELSIGEVARATGLAPSAIRYYEAEGILPEARRVGGKRRYPVATLERLDLVKTTQNAGFSLDEIKVIMSGVDEGKAPGKRAFRALAERKLPEIEESLKRLKLIHRLLSTAMTCGCPDLATCAAAAKRAGLGPDAKRKAPQRRSSRGRATG